MFSKARIMTGSIVAAVLLGGGLAAIPAPASAHPAAVRPQKPTPALGDDVYEYHPIIKSVVQSPPLDNLIRFRMEAYTNFMPHTFHSVVHLERWRSALQLKRPRGAWVEILPTVRYTKADLPAVGHHEYLDPPAQWTCLTGRFYIKVHTFGITHANHPSSGTAYFPWAGFNIKHLNKGNVHKPPSLRQAWHTNCQGDDTLIGSKVKGGARGGARPGRDHQLGKLGRVHPHPMVAILAARRPPAYQASPSKAA